MIRDQALAASGLLVAEARRPAREALPARGRLGGGHVRQQALPAGPRRGALSPQPLHVLAADRRPDRVLRHRHAPDLRRQAGPHQHAAARADDAERRDLRRGRPRPGRARAPGRPARRTPRRASTGPSAWSSPAGRPHDETARCCSPACARITRRVRRRPRGGRAAPERRRVAARRRARPDRARRLHRRSARRSSTSTRP